MGPSGLCYSSQHGCTFFPFGVVNPTGIGEPLGDIMLSRCWELYRVLITQYVPQDLDATSIEADKDVLEYSSAKGII